MEPDPDRWDDRMARRRSENVGWGPVCQSVNRVRRDRDRGDDPDREYRPRRDEGQHPNSAAFEERGRVVSGEVGDDESAES